MLAVRMFVVPQVSGVAQVPMPRSARVLSCAPHVSNLGDIALFALAEEDAPLDAVRRVLVLDTFQPAPKFVGAFVGTVQFGSPLVTRHIFDLGD